jgi:hypothetical protein
VNEERRKLETLDEVSIVSSATRIKLKAPAELFVICTRYHGLLLRLYISLPCFTLHLISFLTRPE